MKKWVFVVVAILVVALSTAIGVVISNNDNSGFIFKISEISLEVNSHKEIEYESSDECNVNFSIKDTSIATVENNMIYAVKIGKTYLDVEIKHGNTTYYRSVLVKVTTETPSFHFDYENSLGIYFGDNTSFAPTIEKGTPTFNYTSSDPTVASINDNGTITTNKCGSVEISVSYKNEVIKTCQVAITANFAITSEDDCIINGSTITVHSNTKTTFCISFYNRQNERVGEGYQGNFVNPSELNAEYAFNKYSVQTSANGILEIQFNEINTTISINVEVV